MRSLSPENMHCQVFLKLVKRPQGWLCTVVRYALAIVVPTLAFTKNSEKLWQFHVVRCFVLYATGFSLRITHCPHKPWCVSDSTTLHGNTTHGTWNGMEQCFVPMQECSGVELQWGVECCSAVACACETPHHLAPQHTKLHYATHHWNVLVYWSCSSHSVPFRFDHLYVPTAHSQHLHGHKLSRGVCQPFQKEKTTKKATYHHHRHHNHHYYHPLLYSPMFSGCKPQGSWWVANWVGVFTAFDLIVHLGFGVISHIHPVNLLAHHIHLAQTWVHLGNLY